MLFNVVPSCILGELISNCNSNAFTSVLVHFFKEALQSTDVKISTDKHVRKVKEYLKNLSKVHTAQLKGFVKDTIEKMLKNNGRMELNVGDHDGDVNNLVQEAIDWSIFKLKNNTLTFNCNH